MHQTVPPAYQRSDEIRAWLYGYITTSCPGHRELGIGSSIVRVPSGTYRWDLFIDALATALNDVGWRAEISTSVMVGGQPYGGRVLLTDQGGGAKSLRGVDCLALLLGLGIEPGETTLKSDTSFTAPFLPWGGVPLYSAKWRDVTLDRELRRTLDRTGRGLGYGWGGARLWATTLRMSRQALEVVGLPGVSRGLGWMRSGRIAIVPSGMGATPMTSADPNGYLDGRIVQVGQPRWQGPLELIADVPMIVATDSS